MLGNKRQNQSSQSPSLQSHLTVPGEIVKIVEMRIKLLVSQLPCAGSSFLRAGFSRCREWGSLHCSAQVTHCGGFSYCEAWALECRLSSCGAWAWLFRSMWDPPGPRIVPMSPCIGRWILNHQTIKEALSEYVLHLYGQALFALLSVVL